jgi:hypothetical protein
LTFSALAVVGTPRPSSLRTRPVFDHFGTAAATASQECGSTAQIVDNLKR